MLNSIILSLAAAFIGCGGSGEDSEPAGIVLTVSPESISAPAEGGTYTVNVSTTGQEWGTAVGNDFFTVKTQGTTAQAGTLTITVPANPVAETRSGAVTVMSGSARKTVTVTQAAAEKAAYYAPEGYYLVWQDEFNEGTELNKVDWTHEVQNSGWVNHELQNYVNHTTPKGRHVTELMDGKLLIHCFKEDGKIYSGRVYAHVKEGWKYGYIEASIKLPKGKGTWPAFWMMPVNFHSWPADGEIDIMEEVGYHPDFVSSSLHANAHAIPRLLTRCIARVLRASSIPTPSSGRLRTSPPTLMVRCSSLTTTRAWVAMIGHTTIPSMSSSTSHGVVTGVDHRVSTRMPSL